MDQLKQIVLSIVLSSLLLGQDRVQLSPTSPLNLNYRYKLIKQNNASDLLLRPYLIENVVPTRGLVVQLQPTAYKTKSSLQRSLKSWLVFTIKPSLQIVNEMQIYYADQNLSEYVGHKWRRISGLTNQSYLHWQSLGSGASQAGVQIGRFYHQTGPGRTGQLLSGRAARPLDQVLLTYGFEINDKLAANFEFQSSALDNAHNSNRYIVRHRLKISSPHAYFAVSEALLYSKSSGGLEPVYLNPFIFYHLEQLNGPNLNGNTFGTIELGVTQNQSHLYLEFLIDDIQLDNEVVGDLEPNEIGIILGLEHASQKMYWGIETVAITNRTYKTADPSEWYVHRNMPMGYELGSDLGRLNVISRYYLKPTLSIDAEIDMVWQGEGDLSQPWDTPWNQPSVTMETGYSELFPTGVVEQSGELRLGVLMHWSNERWITLDLGMRSVNNLDHNRDKQSETLFVNVSGSWSVGRSFQF